MGPRSKKEALPEDVRLSGKIAKALCDEIRAGTYGEGLPFPSLTRIMERFSISRPSAAKSVAELKRLGLVETRRGSGTYVAKRRRTIGVAIPGTADSEFFQAIMDGLVFNCQKSGMDLIAGDVFPKDHALSAREAERLASHLAERKVSGVIMQPIGFNAEAAKINRAIARILSDAKIPVVLIDNDIVPSPNRSRHDLVAINNFDAGRRVATHLLSVGAKRVACLLRRLSAESVWTRYAGVDDALMRTKGRPAFRIEAEPDDAKAVAAGLKKHRPDAIVCSNDIAAAKLMETLKSLNVRIPEDVMVAGFDDVKLAAECNPGLTTIHQPCFELASAAFQTLIGRIENPDLPPREILLDAPLVVRNSTKLPPPPPETRRIRRQCVDEHGAARVSERRAGGARFHGAGRLARLRRADRLETGKKAESRLRHIERHASNDSLGWSVAAFVISAYIPVKRIQAFQGTQDRCLSASWRCGAPWGSSRA